MQQGGGILVVGADGMIGKALAERFVRTGANVVRTTRHGGRDSLPLDLAVHQAGWQIPAGLSVAFLCAAITSTKECCDHPETTRVVNVDGTVALASHLAAAGVRVVFLSTNLVFDGSSPFSRTDAPTCPRTAYGQMKAETEQGILEHGNLACVVRLTKVIGPPLPLLAHWRDSLKRGEPIHPFSDMVMAPVSLSFAIRALASIAKTNVCGIFHGSASEDITYAEAARRLADRMGADCDLVQSIRAVESGISLEHIPQHSTLDSTRLTSEFGWTAPSALLAIDELAQSWTNL